MHNTMTSNYFSPANSVRKDIAEKVKLTASTLSATGRTSFSHLELLSAATTQRPFPAAAVATLRHMIAIGILTASVSPAGVEHLRERRVSDFVIQRLLKEPSARLSEIDQLSALTITRPHFQEQAA